MADKNLNSITFPGMSDKYRINQIANEYSSSSTYAVGDIVNYLGTTYRCTTAITTAENWTVGHWTPVKIANEVTDLKSAIGNKSNLNTDTKANLVSAINEVNGHFLDGIDTAVENWLDNHPEATTTVQDGSLTYEKLVTGTLGFVTPQMYGAKGDGETDDTEAIQQCLDENHFIFFPDGTYMIDPTHEIGAGQSILSFGGIKPQSNTTIILSENTVLKALKNESGWYSIISIIDVDNLKIFGGKIEGVKTNPEINIGQYSGEFGHGILINGVTQNNGCTNILIYGVEIYNCFGDCICVSGNYYHGDVFNIKIVNCNLHDSRRHGISIGRSKGLEISSCYIHDFSGFPSFSCCIDIEGTNNNYSIENVCLTNNVFENGERLGVVFSNYLKDVNVSNCRFSNLSIYNSEYSVISNCFIQNFSSSTGENIISNCQIGTMDIRVLTQNTVFTGCRFYNCYDATLLGSSINISDVSSNKSANVIFNDCVFDLPESPETLTYGGVVLRTATNVQNTELILSFNTCKFIMKDRSAFIGGSGTPRWLQLIFDSCLFVLNRYDTLFVGVASLRLNNSKIKTTTNNSARVLTAHGSDVILNYEISNNLFDGAVNVVLYKSGQDGFTSAFSMIVNNNIFLNGSGNLPTIVSAANSETVSNVTVIGSNMAGKINT